MLGMWCSLPRKRKWFEVGDCSLAFRERLYLVDVPEVRDRLEIRGFERRNELGPIKITPPLKTWKRKWHPTLVLLPGRSHGWRSLAGYSPRGREESDATEHLHFYLHLKAGKTHFPV